MTMLIVALLLKVSYSMMIVVLASANLLELSRSLGLQWSEQLLIVLPDCPLGIILWYTPKPYSTHLGPDMRLQRFGVEGAGFRVDVPRVAFSIRFLRIRKQGVTAESQRHFTFKTASVNRPLDHV